MREASGVAANLQSLPSGGGGASPLGDRFQPDLVKGTGNYSVPLHFPAGPNEFKPSLTLVYSTGFGNGPFGLGWRLNPMRIERRTDRGIPSYDDGDADEFILADAGVLVSVGGGRYRPVADTGHWLIQRVDDHWDVRDGSGRTMRFGVTAAARETADGRTFAWCLEEETDAAGNTVAYSYREDGNVRYIEALRYSSFTIQVVYEPRPDVIRNGRAGFLRRTRLRARAIELHCDRLAPTLMRTYRLEYREALNSVSLLERVTLSAEKDGQVSRMPPLTFTYTELDPDQWVIDEPEAFVRPPSISDAGSQFVDLTGDALPDLIHMSGGRVLRWENDGAGRFDGPFPVEGVPSIVSLERGNVGFADLNGNGRVDLFAVDQPLQIAFQADARGGFQSDPIVFASAPSVGLADPTTRLVDVNGDGVVDVLATERTHHLLFRHRPGQGFEGPQAIERVRDLRRFPDVSFEDRGVAVADMTGDGLQDMVVLRSGSVVYWPYLGDGRWGERVVMDNPPVLPDGYREERLHLVDLDGSGCADIVYVDGGRILVWFNRSGNGFTDSVELPIGVTGDGRVIPVDLYGDGRPGLAWNFAPSDTDKAGFLFLRFNPGVAPYLMNVVDNGMGGRFEMGYTTTTEMRRRDRDEFRLWAGELPIVVHVVGSLRDIDTVTGRRSERQIRYHDGIFDGPQRDFRGFHEVEVVSPGDESVPTNRQVVTHFTGDPHAPDLAEQERQRALVGAVEGTRTFELQDGRWELRRESNQTWEVRTEHDAEDQRVFFPHLTRIETTELGRDEANRIDIVEFGNFDEFGNPGFRRRESTREGAPAGAAISSEERFTYTRDLDSWLVKLPERLEYRDGTGVPHSVQIRHYDGAGHEGLPQGQVERGLVTRVLELRMLDGRMPVGYGEGHDFTELGYVRAGTGDTAGWYATTYSVERDARGNVIENRGPLGDTVRFRYDADGVYPEATVDPTGGETQMTFDPRSGEPSELRYPDGRVVQHEYDPIGRLQSQAESDDDGNLQMTKCWFVTAAVPLAITSVAPRASGRQRSEFDAVELTAAEGVSVSRVFYDGFGQEAFQIATGPANAAGARRFVVHGRARVNPRGLAAVRFRPEFVPDLDFVPAPAALGGGEERLRYDLDGNLADIEGPGGERFRVERDTFTVRHFQGAAAGPFHTVFDTLPPPAPGAPSRSDRFDARERLVGVEESRGDGHTIVTEYRLTVDGRIAEVVDGAGQTVVTYEFAGPGDPLRITHRDIGTRTYYYDAAGRLVERRETDDSITFFTHDSLGRMRRIDHDSGDGVRTPIRTIHYDADPEAPEVGRFLRGRIALIEEGDAKIRFDYRPGGKTRREAYTVAGETLAVTRSHDLQGRITRIEYPDGAPVDYTLDDAGMIAEIPGFVSGVEYDARGAVQSYRQGNGVEVTYLRDPMSARLQQIAAIKDGDVLRRITYGFDEVGAIDAVTDDMPNGTEHHAFTYDGLYRLSSFDRFENDPAGAVLQAGTYEYDDLGNLRRLEEAIPLTMQYADPARPSRLTSVTAGAAPPIPVFYNGRAHVSRFDRLTHIEYDPLDRATRFVRQDSVEIHLRFDHESRRILKEVQDGGTVTRTRYVSGLFEQHSTHQLRHVYFGRGLVATERIDPSGRSVVFYLSDQQGTPLLTTDATGAVLANERVSPFGSSWSGGGLDRFVGRVADEETGLVHLGVRFYSPQLGRFFSADWYALENPQKPALLPQAYNPYAYALNNPVVLKDPSGLFVFLIVGALVALAIGAVVATAVAFTIGLVAGLVYGLTHGQGWGSLLTALETALLTTVGMWLGAVTGFLVGGPVGLIVGGAMGGMNGLISGMHGIYDWGSWKGWMAFLSDSTWGLAGTTLGNTVHIINVFWPDSNYRHDLSHRQNRHVYEGGVRLKNDYAFTLGNVISNAGRGGKGVNMEFIAQHEELHIWQSRIFGPLFQGTYVAWGVGGLIVGTIVWLTDTDEDWGSLVETAAYFDNPFEYWAYKNNDNWPPSGSNPKLRWGGADA